MTAWLATNDGVTTEEACQQLRDVVDKLVKEYVPEGKFKPRKVGVKYCEN